jgi:hypothetical protein
MRDRITHGDLSARWNRRAERVLNEQIQLSTLKPEDIRVQFNVLLILQPGLITGSGCPFQSGRDIFSSSSFPIS